MKKPVKYRWVPALLLVVFVASSVLLYGRGLDNHLVSDDWVFVFRVSKAHGLSDLSQFFAFDTRWFVRPAQWMTTWAIYQVAALNPVPYHLVSVVLEFIATLLLGFFAYRLLRAYQRPPGNYAVAAVIVAMLFRFNWRHHEAVFWYSSVNELVASCFKLSSLLLVTYLIQQRAKTRIVLITAAALGAFALALLSKESAIVLPLELALLLLLDYVVQRRDKSRLALYALLLIPFILLSAFWAYYYLPTSTADSLASVQRGGLALLHTSPRNYVIRFLQYLNANYLGAESLGASTVSLKVELGVLVLFSLAALVRRRTLWLFALFWTLIATAPYALATGGDPVKSQAEVLAMGVADRFLFYPAAGASLLVVTSAAWLLDAFRRLVHRSKWPELVLRGLIGLALLVFMARNAQRIIESEADWDVAGRIGDSIVQQIHELVPSVSAGEALCVGNLPYGYHGNKYIFLNGISEALYLAYSRDDFGVRAAVYRPWVPEEQRRLDETNCSHILYYDGNATMVRAK